MAVQHYLGWLDLQRHRQTVGEDLRRLQELRLRRLLEHSYENVPIYREAFKARNLAPEDIRSLDDLAKIPVLDRQQMQSLDIQSRLARGVDPRLCLIRHTGGSSGIPLAFYGLPGELTYEALGWLRTWRRLGLKLRDRQATIKYPDDIVVRRSGNWHQRLGVLRVSYLDLRKPMPDLLDELLDLQPEVLRAPPSVLLSLAHELEAREHGTGLGPRLVFSTSEKLNRVGHNYLEKVLQAQVHDCYGATEAGCIAWRCPECGAYHVNSDYVHLEILKDGRRAEEGEVGEVIVTNLFRFAMPIIRLSLGDLCEVAAPTDCSMAAGSISLKRIVGRTIESFQLPDGSEISPYSFMPDDIPGVLAYQIVQEAPGQVRIFVVPGADLSSESLEKERTDYQNLLDGKITISFSLVDRLPSFDYPASRHALASVQI